MIIWISPAVLIIAGVFGLILAMAVFLIWRRLTHDASESSAGQKKHKKKVSIVAVLVALVFIIGVSAYYVYVNFIDEQIKPKLEVTRIIRESDPLRRNTFTISGVTNRGCTLFVDGERKPIAQDGKFSFVKTIEPNSSGKLVSIKFVVKSTTGAETVQTHRVKYIDQ